MYYEETKRIEIDQIDKICAVFNCKIEDLLEYVPDENERNIKPLSRIGGFCFASVSINFFEIRQDMKKEERDYNKKMVNFASSEDQMKEFLFGEV
jgi:hypothetical protein